VSFFVFVHVVVRGITCYVVRDVVIHIFVVDKDVVVVHVVFAEDVVVVALDVVESAVSKSNSQSR
jgi:hypothetical protein